MRLYTNTPADGRVAAFLLVDEEDPMLTEVPDLDLTTITVTAEVVPTDGSPTQLVTLPVRSAGQTPGWYTVLLPEVTVPANIVLIAQAPGTHKWRDIIQVEAPPVVADVQAAIAEEFARWTVELGVPVKFVRAGSST